MDVENSEENEQSGQFKIDYIEDTNGARIPFVEPNDDLAVPPLQQNAFSIKVPDYILEQKKKSSMISDTNKYTSDVLEQHVIKLSIKNASDPFLIPTLTPKSESVNTF